MTTLAKDTPRDFGLGDVYEFPVVATDILYEGSAIGHNGSGAARPLVAGDPFLGFALRQADNAAGAAAAINVQLARRGTAKLVVTGVDGWDDVGKDVYASDDNAFTLTASTNTRIGKVVAHVSGTTCWVEFEAVDAAALAALTSIDLDDDTGATADAEGDLAAAAAGACAGGSSPSATNVDAAIATAVAPLDINVATIAAQFNALRADVAALRATVQRLTGRNGA
ncbi:MAG: cytoplasmic protein [Vicinamibacterales bacterium]